MTPGRIYVRRSKKNLMQAIKGRVSEFPNGKIHILCDLHVEFGNFVPPVVGADVVVLAGDVHVKNRGLQWIFDQKFEVPVLYVLGNHEFYREKFPGLIDKLKMGAEGTNVHVLENDSVEIGGYRFFGCTLWSDMELLG